MNIRTETKQLTYGRALHYLRNTNVPADLQDFIERAADMMEPVKIIQSLHDYKVKKILFTTRRGNEVELTA